MSADTPSSFDRETKLYEMAREILRHEDTIINGRITWFMVLQGVLFSAFVNGVGLFEKGKFFIDKPLYLGTGLFCIGTAGVAYCFFVRTVTDHSYLRMHLTIQWWEAQQLDTRDFPPLILLMKPTILSKMFGSHTLAHFIFFIWLVVLFLLSLAARTSFDNRRPQATTKR